MYRDIQDSQPPVAGGRVMNSSSKSESKPAVRYVGRRQYNVKAFSAEQVPNTANEPASPETDDDFIPANSSYRRALSPVYRRPQMEGVRYLDSVTKPKKRSWWKGIMPKALVCLFVVAVLFILFRPIPSSAEDSGPLSMNLPQILSKMLPQLNIFVQATGDDMVQIGKAYVNNTGGINQSSDPGQSLDSMIAGIKDINKELGNTDSGNGMWDQVQDVFKSMRQEAWSVATRGGK